ncbi:hypothetical protein AAZU54_18530 [Pseudomonas sp. Je.1.5.c]|uniref:hypothetical protein n=1 Tax=Pseudomonas sp. Je.1.5.c TaxID=3142839 RepID=UPI003DA8261A
MRQEERVASPLVRPVTDEAARCSVIYSDAFLERKKKKDYKTAIAQILERAKKLNW